MEIKRLLWYTDRTTSYKVGVIMKSKWPLGVEIIFLLADLFVFISSACVIAIYSKKRYDILSLEVLIPCILLILGAVGVALGGKRILQTIRERKR